MGFIDNMTLRAKLLLLTAIMMISLAIVGILGVIGANGRVSDIEEIGQNRLVSIAALAQLRTGINQYAIEQNRVRAYDTEYKSQDTFADCLKNMEKGLGNVDAGLKIYEPLPQTKEEEGIWKEFTESYTKWRKVAEDMKVIVSKLAVNQDPKVQDQLFIEYNKELVTARPIRVATASAIGKVAKYNEELGTQESNDGKNTAVSQRMVIIVVSTASFIFSIILSALIISSTTRQISTAVRIIHDGTMQISDAADQVASSSTSLAQGASEQASSVEEVSATLEEASAAVTSNTENARQADMLSKAANQAAKEGMVKGDSLVVSMKEVNDSAAKIAGIVKAIDQIAFQVNLLALNAAVEAARAGEHGLGFAVVADEVRNLAQRAANSAKETAVVIEEAVTQIKKGSEIANDASSSFRDIDDKAKKVSNLIGEVAMSSKEQAEAVGQLNMAMGQIDQVTQQVAANSEEAAASSEELSAQSQALLEAVGSLAKVVGLDFGSHTPVKSASRQRPGIAPRVMAKPKPMPKKIAQAHPKSDDIFPLDEGDLKEF